MANNQYKHNHYVPEWYQKRFLENGNKHFHYLNLKPKIYKDKSGKIAGQEHALQPAGPKSCFAQDDLYTRTFNGLSNRDIEQHFFGKIDNLGKEALEFWSNYNDKSSSGRDQLAVLMTYMSLQKLRTPKGLGWLKSVSNTSNTNSLLQLMVGKAGLFRSIWVESVWQIADASQSNTKFIVSDHPITIYNRELGPRNKMCRVFNDPDIRLHGSHTIFPLSLDKVLILTNLSWARNPYQSAKKYRPYPIFERPAMFNYFQVQTDRKLDETEVREINYIIKARAHKYIAASNKEWLYPEKHISRSNWNVLGDGILLLPDPRSLNYGGSMFGEGNGFHYVFDAFGRPGGHPEFERDDNPTPAGRYDPLDRIKGEFAHRFGPKRRGRASGFGEREPEVDRPTMHEYYLSLDKRRLRQEKSRERKQNK